MSSGEEVLVVVKSASLQHADLPVKCSNAWTVAQLKRHITEQHPSKPPAGNQRLIYSGHQLADDSAQLSSVLRQPEFSSLSTTTTTAATPSTSTPQYTIHLVCSAAAHSQRQMPKTTTTPPPESAVASDGVRQRTVNMSASSLSSEAVGGFGQPPVSPAELSSSLPALQQQQMMAAYTLYAQYWSQYLQALQSGNLAMPASGFYPTPTQQSDPSLSANYSSSAAPAEAAPEPVQRRRRVQEGPRGDQPEVVQWDWLDWLHAMTRLALLLCTVLVYSTGVRLVFVALCIVAVYFYNDWLGRVRRAAPPAANNNLPPAAAAQERPAAAAGSGGGGRSDQELGGDGEDVAAAMAGDRAPDERRMNPDLDRVGMNWTGEPVQQANPASVTWNIICSFFSSLFPGVEAGHI